MVRQAIIHVHSGYSEALPAVAAYGVVHAVCLPHRGTGQHYHHSSSQSCGAPEHGLRMRETESVTVSEPEQ